MLFSVFEKLLFSFYVRKNQNILTFPNIRIKECAKSPAPNEQFATSGGAIRPNGSVEQHLLALVRAFAMPPAN